MQSGIECVAKVPDLEKEMAAFVLLSFQLHPIESPDFGQLTRVQGLATPNQLAVSYQFELDAIFLPVAILWYY